MKKKFLCFILTGVLVLMSLPAFAIGIPQPAVDKAINYRCSFDIPLSEDFAAHPVYQYAENGILHVTIRQGFYPYFTFGTTQQITLQAANRATGSTWNQPGEYEIPGRWVEKFTWESETSFGKTGCVLKGFQLERISIGDSDNPDLAVDLVEEDDGLMIRMYLFRFNDGYASGVIKPITEMVEYMPESFQEDRSMDGDEFLPRTVFKRNGTWSSPPEGSDEADQIQSEWEEIAKPQPSQNTDEENPDEENPDEKSPDEEKPSSAAEIPEAFEGLTKEESIEEHSGYYDEDGQYHRCTFYNGVNGGKRMESELTGKVEFTIFQNFDGISSDGKTQFTLYDILIHRVDPVTGEPTRWRDFDFTLLCMSGNLGEKKFTNGNTVWRQPEGTSTSIVSNLDPNSAHYGWREVYEVTDEYFDMTGDDIASIQVNFTDAERTGITSYVLDFCGQTYTVSLSNIDYTGPFLTYFLCDAENWPEMAKAFGLLP